MKVVLSRKGFDSENGGIASPILPDGTLLSLPIPEKEKYKNGRAYSELSYKDETYERIIKQLKPKFKNKVCHLDPDIREGIFKTPDNWKPAFGQHGGSLTTLRKHGVKRDDLFLFFGLFRQTKRLNENGRLSYLDNEPNKHIIFGYLQIGEIIANQTEIDNKFPWHPHAYMNENNNCLYVPRNTLSWDESKPGYGVFQNESRFVLTKNNCSCSFWNPDEIFKKMPGHWHEDHPIYGKYFETAARPGQEFIFEECLVVEKWAKSLF